MGRAPGTAARQHQTDPGRAGRIQRRGHDGKTGAQQAKQNSQAQKCGHTALRISNQRLVADNNKKPGAAFSARFTIAFKSFYLPATRKETSPLKLLSVTCAPPFP